MGADLVARTAARVAPNGVIRAATCMIGMARWRPILHDIARQIQPDVVVSAAGCRIDEHLGQ